MASYYDFFCQTKNRVAATAVGVVSAAAYGAFTVMTMMRAAQTGQVYQDCLAANATQADVADLQLIVILPADGQNEHPCVEPCLDECVDSSSAEGDSALLFLLGVMAAVMVLIAPKVEPAVTKVKQVFEMHARSGEAATPFAQQAVKPYGSGHPV